MLTVGTNYALMQDSYTKSTFQSHFLSVLLLKRLGDVERKRLSNPVYRLRPWRSHDHHGARPYP